MASSSALKQAVTRIRDLVQRTGDPPESDQVIETGDFRIDLRARTATVRGHEILLTAPEFDLLVFLTTHPRKLITPQTRLTTRWGESQTRQAEFLRVLLQLRKKIEATVDSADYIRTEPWVFYRFSPVAGRR